MSCFDETWRLLNFGLLVCLTYSPRCLAWSMWWTSTATTSCSSWSPCSSWLSVSRCVSPIVHFFISFRESVRFVGGRMELGEGEIIETYLQGLGGVDLRYILAHVKHDRSIWGLKYHKHHLVAALCNYKQTSIWLTFDSLSYLWFSQIFYLD